MANDSKKILIGMGIIILLLAINNATSLTEIKQNIPLIKCFDYDYKIEFEESELPATIEFYILENGEEEFFKRDIANEKFESTLLHCGHDYKVVYTFKDNEPFVDYVTVPEETPLIKKTTKISIN